MRKRGLPITAETTELAFRACEMRAELDSVMKKYGMRLQVGWEGKWAYVQAAPIEGGPWALTLVRVAKGGKTRYLMEAEEILRESDDNK